MFLGKAFSLIVFVFSHSLDQVTCHADIKRAISLAGEDVDTGLLHFTLLDSRLRGDDGINEPYPLWEWL